MIAHHRHEILGSQTYLGRAAAPDVERIGWLGRSTAIPATAPNLRPAEGPIAILTRRLAYLTPKTQSLPANEYKYVGVGRQCEYSTLEAG